MDAGADGIRGFTSYPTAVLPSKISTLKSHIVLIQGGSNMTGTDLYVNKPHCAAAVRP